MNESSKTIGYGWINDRPKLPEANAVDRSYDGSSGTAFYYLSKLTSRMDPDDALVVQNDEAAARVRVADVRALLDFYVKYMTVDA